MFVFLNRSSYVGGIRWPSVRNAWFEGPKALESAQRAAFEWLSRKWLGAAPLWGEDRRSLGACGRSHAQPADRGPPPAVPRRRCNVTKQHLRII